MKNEFSDDPALLQDFLTECGELLQQLDQDLVALESAPEDTELLNRAFRALHTIKGTSGFMGFGQVVELSHAAEDVLNLLRKGERKVTRETMDVLLTVLDQLQRMMADIGNGKEADYQLASLLARLRALVSAAPAPQDTPQTPGETRPDKPHLGEILVVQQAITHTELSESLAEASSSARRLGEVLVEKQLVAPSQVREALEQQSTASEQQQEAAQTVRVRVDKLDHLVNLVGELVLERNRIAHLSREFPREREAIDRYEAALGQSAARLSLITAELQVASLSARMVPIDVVFRKFPRLVRDISRSLAKQVQLEIRGEDTELDKTMVEQIGDPLVHLVRNSLDHGIEAPDVREARGKPAKGTVRLEAEQEGDSIVITVSDDGAGIDPERIAAKAIEKGLVPAERVRAMSRREILDLVFLPGFSTAERVSNISGRGVGMDVVSTNLKRLNGVVELDGEPGQGTIVRLRLPLTLAILPALLVGVAGETYALPLSCVVEAAQISAGQVHQVDGSEILQFRADAVPLLRLRRLFNLDQQQNATLRVVVIAAGEKRVALAVDELLGQEETVIKPLGSYLRGIPGLAGSTIAGDGRVRLILDPGELAGKCAVTVQ